ncbi:conjugal transfer protein TraD, partial [Acinetobacter baumannii]
GADRLAIDELAGALLAAAGTKDTAIREAWRKAGAAMFQGKTEHAQASARSNSPQPASPDDGTLPLDRGAQSWWHPRLAVE